MPEALPTSIVPASYPLLSAPVHRQSNKLSNLQRLAGLSSTLDFSVPEAHVLLDNHFVLALQQVCLGEIKHLLIETTSPEELHRLRQALLVNPLPPTTQQALRAVHQDFSRNGCSPLLCVRSMFELEDLHGHSFAGAFETVDSVDSYETLCRAAQVVFASVFTDRAFSEMRNARLSELPLMSVAIQRMIGGAGWCGGVAHTQSPDLAPFPLMLFSVSYNSAVVTSGGTVPEDYMLHRGNLEHPERKSIVQTQAGSHTGEGGFAFTDSQLRRHASTMLLVEEAFECPLEIEWMVDPEQHLHLLQARTFFVDNTPAMATSITADAFLPVCTGLPVGSGRVSAEVRRVHSLSEALHVPPGSIIVAENTDPDWVGVVRAAAGLVTSIGSRTSHVSRTAREASVLAVVACGDAIDSLTTGMLATIVCAEGIQGAVYSGELPDDALAVSTDDAYLTNAAAAFSLARCCQPERVYFDASQVLASLRLPDPSNSVDSTLTERLKRRIAGHGSIELFAENKLVEAVALVSTAFPMAETNVSIEDSSPWSYLLPNVVSRCEAEYGLTPRLTDHSSASSRKTPVI